MKFVKSLLPFVVIIILSFWAIKPLFVPGFFPMHDDTQVARVFEMTKSLKDGMFPVRWVSDLGYGYGYPIFNFYAPLAYYVGSIFMFLGFDALAATKIMMGVGIILSGVFMYLLGREFWGRLGGVVSALFYVYAPFHAVDIYVRGDVSEFWAYAFIPLMFWGFYKVFKHKADFKWVVVASFGYAGVILSHNLTAMMVSPFLLTTIIYLFYKARDRRTILFLLVSLLLGFSLSAFYFIPALLEQRYTNVLSQLGGGADFRDHFVCLSQFWQSEWGFGGSTPQCFDGLSFVIGRVHILASLLAVFLSAVVSIRKKENKSVLVLISTLGVVVSVFIMLSISKPLWEYIPLIDFFQYPWRFLIMTSFFTSLIVGSLPLFIKILPFKKVEYVFCIILIVILLGINAKFFNPQTIFNKNVNDYTGEVFLKWNTSKISDEYMPRDFIKPSIEKDIVNDRVILDSDNIKINSRRENTGNIELDLEVIQQSKLHFNIAYFPSWSLYVDGSSKGSIVSKGYDVSLSKGHHVVQMKFVETGIQRASSLLSLAGLIVVVVGIILSKKRASYG